MAEDGATNVGAWVGGTIGVVVVVVLLLVLIRYVYESVYNWNHSIWAPLHDIINTHSKRTTVDREM